MEHIFFILKSKSEVETACQKLGINAKLTHAVTNRKETACKVEFILSEQEISVCDTKVSIDPEEQAIMLLSEKLLKALDISEGHTTFSDLIFSSGYKQLGLRNPLISEEISEFVDNDIDVGCYFFEQDNKKYLYSESNHSSSDNLHDWFKKITEVLKQHHIIDFDYQIVRCRKISTI